MAMPGGPALAGTRMSTFAILLEQRVMVVTTGAIRHAKLQSNQHHQETNTHFYPHNALHGAVLAIERCPSHPSIVSKWPNLSYKIFDHLVAPLF